MKSGIRAWHDKQPPSLRVFPCDACTTLQLYTIHDITCGPAFKSAALGLLKAAEADEDEEQTEPVIIVLETLR